MGRKKIVRRARLSTKAPCVATVRRGAVTTMQWHRPPLDGATCRCRTWQATGSRRCATVGMSTLLTGLKSASSNRRDLRLRIERLERGPQQRRLRGRCSAGLIDCFVASHTSCHICRTCRAAKMALMDEKSYNKYAVHTHRSAQLVALTARPTFLTCGGWLGGVWQVSRCERCVALFRQSFACLQVHW